MQVAKMSEKAMRSRFRTEKQCREYLMALKYPNGLYCKQCGNKRMCWHNEKKTYRCSRCHHHESAKSGTLFHASRVSLRDWFWAIYLFTASKGGISAKELQRRLEFGSYKTAWLLLHKLRKAMQKRDGNYDLKGVIELDGAHYGKQKTKNQSTFYIAIESHEHHAGFAAASCVEYETAKNAQEFVKQCIRTGSMVNTDGHYSFSSVDKHWDIHHDYQYADAKHAHTHWMTRIHPLISHIKRMLLGTYHGVTSKYLQLYLSEYIYRFNRRYWPEQLFYRLLNASVTAGPTPHVALSG